MKFSRIVPTACFLLLAGCMNANADRGSDVVEAPENDVTVEFRVENAQGEVARRFTPGGSVHFVFNVKNTTGRAQQLAYTFPPHRVQVFSKGNKEPVWQAWQGQMFPQVMRNKTVAADGNETFSIEWQISADIAPGRYRIKPAFHGFVGNTPLAPEMETFEITIE